MHIYTAYRLIIHSQVQLGELVVAEGPPDVTVTLADPKEEIFLTSDGGLQFVGEVEGIGTFAVLYGEKIIVYPAPDVGDKLLSTFIIGPILAVLLRQRGLLVLHASSVVVNNVAISFLGNSGAGKSTLAEVFYSQGYQVLTDDVMVIQLDESGPLVLPGYPQIKLWPESATATGHLPEDLPTIHPLSTKLAHRLSTGFGQMAFPLSQIYVLGQGDQHRIESINSANACLELVRHSRAANLLTNPAFRMSNFQKCSLIAQSIPVYRFERKPDLSDLPALVRLVKSNLDNTLSSVN